MKQTLITTIAILLLASACDDHTTTRKCAEGCYVVGDPNAIPLQCFCPTDDDGGETTGCGETGEPPADLPRPPTLTE